MHTTKLPLTSRGLPTVPARNASFCRACATRGVTRFTRDWYFFTLCLPPLVSFARCQATRQQLSEEGGSPLVIIVNLRTLSASYRVFLIARVAGWRNYVIYYVVYVLRSNGGERFVVDSVREGSMRMMRGGRGKYWSGSSRWSVIPVKHFSFAKTKKEFHLHKLSQRRWGRGRGRWRWQLYFRTSEK